MATAKVAPEPQQQNAVAGNRMAYVQACVNKYYDWRDAGNCPLDLPTQLAVLIPDGGTWDGCDEDALALLYWDRTENGGSLFNYESERNYRRALIQQASQVLLTYTRHKVTAAWGKVTVPGVARVPLAARAAGSERFSLRKVSTMTKSELDLVIESMQAAVKTKALRARQLGAHRRAIQNALLAAEEEANKLFEN